MVVEEELGCESELLSETLVGREHCKIWLNKSLLEKKKNHNPFKLEQNKMTHLLKISEDAFTAESCNQIPVLNHNVSLLMTI